jgi:hypothetical protein
MASHPYPRTGRGVPRLYPFRVYVGEALIGTFPGWGDDDGTEAVAAARRWLFATNPGRLGEIDGSYRSEWHASPAPDWGNPDEGRATA